MEQARIILPGMVTNTLADWVHTWRCPRIWHPSHCSQREISRLGLLLQCCVHGSSAGKGRDEWEPPKKQSRDYSSKQCMVLIDIVFWSPSSFSEGTQKCQIGTLLGSEPGQILPLTLLRSPQWSQGQHCFAHMGWTLRVQPKQSSAKYQSSLLKDCALL